MKRNVVDRSERAAWKLHRQRREREHVVVAGQSPLEPFADLVGVDSCEEADLAEVDCEHGHARARVTAKPFEDRAVTAERETKVHVVRELDAELESVSRLQAVL